MMMLIIIISRWIPRQCPEIGQDCLTPCTYLFALINFLYKLCVWRGVVTYLNDKSYLEISNPSRRVVSTLVSCCRGLWFKSRPWALAILTEVFHHLILFFQQNCWILPEITSHFFTLACLMVFTSLIIRRHVIWAVETVVKWNITTWSKYSWLQAFAVFRMLFVFFWVIPRRSDLYMPTFRNTLSVPSSKAGVKWSKYYKYSWVSTRIS